MIKWQRNPSVQPMKKKGKTVHYQACGTPKKKTEPRKENKCIQENSKHPKADLVICCGPDGPVITRLIIRKRRSDADSKRPGQKMKPHNALESQRSE